MKHWRLLMNNILVIIVKIIIVFGQMIVNIRNIIFEFPDDNGNVIPYIAVTCSFDNIKSKNYNNTTCETYENGIHCVYLICNLDSQCLSNKCIENLCVFNDETPIDHYNDICSCPFLFNTKKPYMFCGKAFYYDINVCYNNNNSNVTITLTDLIVNETILNPNSMVTFK